MKVLVLILSLVAACSIHSQIVLSDNPVFRVSQHDYKAKPGEEELFFSSDDQFAFRTPAGKESHDYTFYNSQMEVVKRTSSTMQDFLPGEMTLLCVHNINNDLFGFAYHTDSKQKKNTIYCVSWNKEKFQFENEVVIMELSGNQYFKKLGEGFPGISVSKNDSKILFSIKDNSSKSPLQFLTKVFASDLTTLEEFTVVLDDNGPMLPYSSKWEGEASLYYRYDRNMDNPFSIDDEGTIAFKGENK